MKIATWNVNSIRARQDRLLAWLEKHQPDALCLQETKVIDDDFPCEELRNAGYHSVFWGQKSYNGVAILTRSPSQDMEAGFGDKGDNSQARIIAATFNGIRLVCVYVPNGKTPNSESYFYKLEWLTRLRGYLERWGTSSERLLLCGDFNVAPDDRDVHHPALWKDDILCTDDERGALSRVVDWGFKDAFRLHHQEGGVFSWWDYRKLGFQKDHGLRIDHVYLSSALVPQCKSAWIDRDERKGVKPSDHAPVVVELDM